MANRLYILDLNGNYLLFWLDSSGLITYTRSPQRHKDL